MHRYSKFNFPTIPNYSGDIDWPMSGHSGMEGCLVYYQPKVDLSSGLPVGAEALVRWQGKSNKILSPAEFLPYIQSKESMHLLDLFVLETVALQAIVWNKQGITPVISVNMSPSHFDNEYFADEVIAVLERVPGFNPRCLALEILESFAIENIKIASRSMSRLRELGIRFYLDDFGTGHSSAAYLKLLPIDAIKIDQIFCRDLSHSISGLQDRSIIAATISIAKAFGVQVIAEGIESHAAAIALLELGCRIGQGYYFARPMPAAQFTDWYQCARSTSKNAMKNHESFSLI